MLVNDHRFLCDVDTLLRADKVTQLAADAAFAHIVTLCFLCRFADGEAVPDDVRRVAYIKILAVSFVQTKYL